MEKQTYYISVLHLTCTAYPSASSYNFRVELEPHKARVFQKIFHLIYRLEESNIVRAQLSFIPYHTDHRYKKYMHFSTNLVTRKQSNLFNSSLFSG